jgi:Regulator of ribonuclease activity B
MISREAIEEMFDSTRKRARWNIDGDCLWGYFFTSTDRARLSAAIPALEKMGYRFVTIFEPARQDDDRATLSLHIEKVEAHTVDSLLIRNSEFYRFADEFNLETYDGMDVGPAPTK